MDRKVKKYEALLEMEKKLWADYCKHDKLAIKLKLQWKEVLHKVIKMELD